MVSESKDAASSDDCSHSSLLSSLSSSSSEGQGPKLPRFIHPSISLFTPHFLCVLCRIVATDPNMHVLGVLSTEWPRYCAHNRHVDNLVVLFEKRKGEGKREKGKGRREKGEGKREKGKGRREKGEGKREKEKGRRKK